MEAPAIGWQGIEYPVILQRWPNGVTPLPVSSALRTAPSPVTPRSSRPRLSLAFEGGGGKIIEYSISPISSQDRESIIDIFNYYELDERLKKHELWLAGQAEGERLNLSGEDLSSLNLSDRNLSKAHIEGAKLTGARVDKSLMDDTMIYTTEMQGADLSESKSIEADLEDSDLSEIQADNCIFLGTDFIGSNLLRATFKNCRLMGSIFRDTDCRGADFSYADLKNASFENADLRNCNFEGANLRSANLCNAKIEGVNFHGANMEEVEGPDCSTNVV